MTVDQSLLRVYSDRTFTHTTMVRHQGTALAFAMDDRRRIVYTVLDLSVADEQRGELDAAYWSENPAELPFPNEIVQVGYAVAGATAMPVVKRGGRLEARADEVLEPEEIDGFLSTTARLTAAAPFQVLSDGTHLVVLRQAVGAAHGDAVFALQSGSGSTGDAARTNVVRTTGGAAVPVVADTLLCDRFLLVGGRLKPVSEVRFKRSRHKTQPASAKDSLGAVDMDGTPFHEPTQELEFIRNLTQGRFTALLVPTAVRGQQRWQFFTHNSVTQRIDAFSVEQAEDGLFNTQGSRYWTSPDPLYRTSVFEREDGICPFTGRPLVPVVPDGRHGETALQLNGTNTFLDLGAAAGLGFAAHNQYTVEAWIRPQAAGGPLVARWAGAGSGGFRFALNPDGRLSVQHATGAVVTSTQTVAAGVYTHVAAVYDGTTVALYVNGTLSGSGAVTYTSDGAAGLRIGSAQAGGFFAGVIDEVRIWTRARSGDELAEDLGHRLIGNEPGLAGYYRLDEGSGTRAYDQTDTAAHATLTGTASWVTSGAPVGEHPGVRRDSFTVSGRSVVSGLSAALYYQQEDAASGYDAASQPVKRQARVVLAFASGTVGTTTDPCIATVDFGVGVDGRLADVPDVLTLTDIGRPVQETTDVLAAQERRIAVLESEAAAIRTDVTTLTAERDTLTAALAAPASTGANDPHSRTYKLQMESGVYYLTRSQARTSDGGLQIQPATTSQVHLMYDWILMALPGVQGRYGNPVVTLVSMLQGYRITPLMLDTEGGSTGLGAQLALYERSFIGTIPASSQWYVQGDLVSGWRIKFQNVNSGHWLQWHAVVTEPFAETMNLRGSGDAPDLRRQQQNERLVVVTARLASRTGDLTAKQAEITIALEELARLSGGLLGAADLVLAIPHVGIDTSGLSCAGALLQFARTDSTPFLADSAAGRVALYYRGSSSEFYAAYLDTNASRGAQRLAGGGLTTLFTARDPGITLAGTQITVADCTVGAAVVPGLCDLTITRTVGARSETERFTGLPRRAGDLIAVLNGADEEPLRLGAVERTTGAEVTLTRALTTPVPASAYVRIGAAVHLVTTAAAEGATVLRLAQAPTGAVAKGTEVSRVRYDTGRAASSRPGVLLTGGSQWVTADTDKAHGTVGNGTAVAVAAGYGSRWRGDSPGRAFTFDSAQSHRLSLPAARLDQITTAAGDLTTEAWIKPNTVPSTGARVLHANRRGTSAALALSREVLSGGVTFNGTSDWLLIDHWNPLSGDFTIECWLKRTAGRTVADPIVAIEHNSLVMGFAADGKFQFTLASDSGATDVLTTPTGYTDSDWHHWAITFNRTTRVQTIVRDGVEVARRTAANLPRQRANVVVGRDTGDGYKFFSGSMAELRAWTTVRTPADIGADRNRRIIAAEPGLVGSWAWAPSQPAERRLRDAGGRGLHGRAWENPGACDSPVSEYRAVAAFGDKTRQSSESYPYGQWAHLAAVYEQSWALRFDGTAWAETPDEDRLDITGDLTIEVFAHIDSTTTRQGLLSKGRLGDGAGGTTPYQLSLLTGGKLEFAFEEPGPVVKRFTSANAITPGFHRIAVVRKAGSTTQEIKGRRAFPVTDASGNTSTQEFDVVERVDVQEWQDIRFVVDGTELALTGPTPLPSGTTDSGRYTGPGPRGNDGPLEIGRAQDGTSAHPLKGVIGEVRIWGKARENHQLGTALHPRDSGLIARWTFEENTGNTTADPVGGHDLKLRRARWTTDPDPRASSFTLYRNGRAIPTTTPATSPLSGWGDEQLTLGAVTTSGTFSGFYSGTLEEVRLWRTARTPEQILDNLFTRLKGDKQDLLAYWPFDSESTTATAESVADHSLRGNHLDPGTDATRPRIVLSTAPVSTDTAAVRSALAGVSTPFHEKISAPPASVEYADLQYTPDGQAQGVLKRAYAHIADGVWTLTTGYKVGDLTTEWVSQVQFDPQLIGYIEGAPPVPSENLTGNTDVADVSSVTFTEADEITSVLGSARNRNVDLSFTMAAELGAQFGASTVTAPLGLGVSNPILTVDIKGTIANATDFSNTWTNETTLTQGTSTDRNTTAELTGYWENPAALRNTTVGRRYLPENKGYALVQSETADVYALRLAHTGALVAYRMLPNPDIPKDWNIISFPINPQYTKQGTLDGAIGLTDQAGKILDEAYPTASGYGEYSYFKPREAYAIKRRLLRERQELENFYTSVSTETSAPDPTAERATKILESLTGLPAPAAPDSRKPVGDSAQAFANRSIANTYVWTADGGFFAETTGTVDVVNETTAGSYTFTNTTTGSLGIEVNIGGIGVGYQMEGSLGGGFSVTRQRSREATRAHSLDVTCKPGRDLQKYKADGTPEYLNNKPVLVPGKVDAYRFMTFYLGQDTTHFDDFYRKVIDPTWLANSNDANATALRQARQSDSKPPCWRILHRVTFISRVLPPIPATAPPSLAKDLRAVDVQSNYELIRRLDPYVSTATNSLAELADATRTALATHLPELLRHSPDITRFLAAYYGVTE
ncbi:LamG-like jellyroll fold domain-containing protein [Streptomyces sp. NPDC014894]|uniref:LamG domain-containing protein n=1 Tax=Streptomyces sp. NPDC014894 TaxID=3364931 RepID=UPI0036FBEBCA